MSALPAGWRRLNERVLQHESGRWQIARYQDTPERRYELWERLDVTAPGKPTLPFWERRGGSASWLELTGLVNQKTEVET